MAIKHYMDKIPKQYMDKTMLETISGPRKVENTKLYGISLYTVHFTGNKRSKLVPA